MEINQPKIIFFVFVEVWYLLNRVYHFLLQSPFSTYFNFLSLNQPPYILVADKKVRVARQTRNLNGYWNERRQRKEINQRKMVEIPKLVSNDEFGKILE